MGSNTKGNEMTDLVLKQAAGPKSLGPKEKEVAFSPAQPRPQPMATAVPPPGRPIQATDTPDATWALTGSVTKKRS